MDKSDESKVEEKVDVTEEMIRVGVYRLKCHHFSDGDESDWRQAATDCFSSTIRVAAKAQHSQ
jgi:hypothetical protein